MRRLAQRAEHAGVSAFDTILAGDVDRVEDLYAPSYRSGMGKDLAASTVESQVTILSTARSIVCLNSANHFLQVLQEFKLYPQLGRELQFVNEPDLHVSITAPVKFTAADGSQGELQVSTLFPGNARSVQRCTDEWWQICKVRACFPWSMLHLLERAFLAPLFFYMQGGKPATRSERLTAAARDKPAHRAMPIRFPVLLAVLLYFQREPYRALIECR